MYEGNDEDDEGSVTGTRDLTYNLVSVMYHALQGAATCEQYLKDAYAIEDTALVQYFHEVQRQQRRIAERGKDLLGQRLNGRRVP